MSAPLSRILVVEDVEGNTYEFPLILSEEMWKDKMKLAELAMNLIWDKYHTNNDLTSLNVLVVH